MECPHCGDKFKVPKRYAGTEGTCKACNKAIRVPEVIPSGFVPEKIITRKWLESALKTGLAILWLTIIVIVLIISAVVLGVVDEKYGKYTAREQAKLERIRSGNPELHLNVEALKKEYSTSIGDTVNRLNGKIVSVGGRVPYDQTTSRINQEGLTLGVISENVLIRARFKNPVDLAIGEPLPYVAVIGEARIRSDGIQIVNCELTARGPEPLIDFSGLFGTDP